MSARKTWLDYWHDFRDWLATFCWRLYLRVSGFDEDEFRRLLRFDSEQQLAALQERVRVLEGERDQWRSKANMAWGVCADIRSEIEHLDRGTTHYEHCEVNHPRCRWMKQINALAAALNGQQKG